jgi:hypothetical protein
LDQVSINLSEAHPSREPDLTMVGVPGFSGAILATSASTAIHVSHSPFLKSDKIYLEGLKDDGFLPTADADFLGGTHHSIGVRLGPRFQEQGTGQAVRLPMPIRLRLVVAQFLDAGVADPQYESLVQTAGRG